MQRIHARSSINISELKKNPSAIIRQANGEAVVILNHNRPTAYLLPAATFEVMMEALDDLDLVQLVRERQDESTVRVTLDEPGLLQDQAPRRWLPFGVPGSR